MKAYTTIVNDFVDEFNTIINADSIRQPEVKLVVVDTAELFRSKYYEIVDVEEDELDKGALEDFYEDVREEIVLTLKAHGLL